MRSMRTALVFGLLLVLATSCGDEPKQGGEAGEEPSITSFSPSQESISLGAPVTLSWTTEGASSVRLFAGSSSVALGGASAAQGSVEVRPKLTTTFRLEAHGAQGATASREATVVVIQPEPPAIQSFTASPEELGAGAEVLLSWRTTDATAITLADAEGRPLDVSRANPLEGSITTVPVAATTYVLTATGPGGRDTKETSVVILPGPTVSLQADQLQVPFEGGTTLRWESEGATEAKLFAEGGELPLAEGITGSFEISPSRTTVYYVEATGLAGKVRASRTVSVVPVIDAFDSASTEALRPGVEVSLSWAIRGASGATLSNLSGWTYEIPAAQLAGGTIAARVGAGGVFTLIARDGAVESEQKTVTIKLTGAPKILSAVAAPEISAGRGVEGTLTFSWEVDGAEGPLKLERIPGGNIPIVTRSNRRDSIEIQVKEPGELRLTATNAAGVDQITIPLPVVQPPAFTSFRALPARVASGESVELSWTTDSAASISLLDGATRLPVDPSLVNGSYVQNMLVAGANYRLTATNRLGVQRESDEIVVTIGRPIIASFATSDRAMHPSYPLRVEWKNVGGNQLKVIERGSTQREVCSETDLARIEEGFCEFSAPTALGVYTYVLQVSNGAGVEEREIDAQVTKWPTVLSLDASPATISEGDSVTLTWTAAEGIGGEVPMLELVDQDANVYDLGGADPVEGEITLTIPTAGDHVFTLLAASGDAAPPARREVTVKVIELPIVTSFASAPIFVEANGEPAVLSWTTLHGVSLEIFAVDPEGEIQGAAVCSTTTQVASGNCTVYPIMERPDFRMRIRNEPGGVREVDVRVGVRPAQVVSFTADEYELVEGESTFLRWTTERADQVQLGPAVRELSTERAPYIDVYQRADAQHLGHYGNPEGIVRNEGAFTFPEGFTFSYFGVPMTSAFVCASGAILFNSTNAAYCNKEIWYFPTVLDRGAFVHLAPFHWAQVQQDFPQRRDSAIWYVLLTDPQTGMRSLVIQWSRYIYNAGATKGSLNFEVVLHENGEVDFRYGDMFKLDEPGKANGSEAFVGLVSAAPAPEAVALLSAQSEFPGGFAHRSFRFFPSVAPCAGFVGSNSGVEYSKEIWPTATFSINLLAENVYSSHEREVRVVVHKKVALSGVATEPASPVPNVPFELALTGANIVKVEIEEGGAVIRTTTDPAEIAGGRIAVPGLTAGEHSLTVRVYGSIGDRDVETMTIQVPVFPPFDIDSFTTDMDVIDPAADAVLRWTAHGMEELLLSSSTEGAIAPLPGDLEGGSLTVSPTKTTVYTLLGKSFGRQVSQTVRVGVRSAAVDDVRISKKAVWPGEAITLDWESSRDGVVSLKVTPPVAGAYTVPGAAMVEVSADPTKRYQDISAPGAGGAQIPNVQSSTAKVPFAFPAGFTFPWYGQTKTSINLLRDGRASFAVGTDNTSRITARYPQGLAAGDATQRAFLVFNRTLTNNVGSVWWKQDCGGDCLIFQWTGFRTSTTTDDFNFQLVLFRDGSFEYRYGTIKSGDAWSGWDIEQGSGTYIAWQSPDTKFGFQLNYGGYLSGGLQNRSWRVVPPGLPSDGSLTFTPQSTTTYEICRDDGSWRECKSVVVGVVTGGTLQVTEVMIEDPNDPELQWFEVRNFTNFDIDLRGVTIVGVNYSGLGGTYLINDSSPVIISALGGYKVFASKPMNDANGVPAYVYGRQSGVMLWRQADSVLVGLRRGSTDLTIFNTWYLKLDSVAKAGKSWEIAGQLHALKASSEPSEFNLTTAWCETTTPSPGVMGPSCLASLGGHYDIDRYASMPFLDLRTFSGTGEIAIAAGGTTVAEVPGGVPFAFPFFGSNLAANQPIWVSTGGLASFSSFTPAISNLLKAFPNSGNPGGFLAPFWGANLAFDPQSSRIFYNSGRIGGKDVFGIQWNGINPTSGETLNFQIQIWETGDIVFAFERLDPRAVVGNFISGIEAIGSAQGFSSSHPGFPLPYPMQSVLFKKK